MAKPATATLLISCQDAPGIVAAVAGLIAEHGGNILHSNQHSDPQAGVFFTRQVFELDGFGLPREELAPRLQARLGHLGPSIDVRFSDARKRIAILVSRYDHCLYDLLLRWRGGELRCEVPLVISNHPDLERVARHFERPFRVFPIRPETKQEQEEQVLAALESARVDVVVLARYMQILSRAFVDRYPSRIINIHHSFLPAFQGGRPYHQAHRRGVKLIGATSHYVTEDLDAGPIISQDVVQVSHRDSVADMVRKGRDLEKLVLGQAVRWHVEDRVLVYSNKTVVFGG